MLAGSSRSSLRTPRASFDMAPSHAHHKHVAFADQRPTLKSNNTWSAGDLMPKPKARSTPVACKTFPASFTSLTWKLTYTSSPSFSSFSQQQSATPC
jgi:hypothetical protein